MDSNSSQYFTPDNSISSNSRNTNTTNDNNTANFSQTPTKMFDGSPLSSIASSVKRQRFETSDISDLSDEDSPQPTRLKTSPSNADLPEFPQASKSNGTGGSLPSRSGETVGARRGGGRGGAGEKDADGDHQMLLPSASDSTSNRAGMGKDTGDQSSFLCANGPIIRGRSVTPLGRDGPLQHFSGQGDAASCSSVPSHLSTRGRQARRGLFGSSPFGSSRSTTSSGLRVGSFPGHHSDPHPSSFSDRTTRSNQHSRSSRSSHTASGPAPKPVHNLNRPSRPDLVPVVEVLSPWRPRKKLERVPSSREREDAVDGIESSSHSSEASENELLSRRSSRGKGKEKAKSSSSASSSKPKPIYVPLQPPKPLDQMSLREKMTFEVQEEAHRKEFDDKHKDSDAEVFSKSDSDDDFENDDLLPALSSDVLASIKNRQYSPEDVINRSLKSGFPPSSPTSPADGGSSRKADAVSGGHFNSWGATGSSSRVRKKRNPFGSSPNSKSSVIAKGRAVRTASNSIGKQTSQITKLLKEKRALEAKGLGGGVDEWDKISKEIEGLKEDVEISSEEIDSQSDGDERSADESGHQELVIDEDELDLWGTQNCQDSSASSTALHYGGGDEWGSDSESEDDQIQLAPQLKPQSKSATPSVLHDRRTAPVSPQDALSSPESDRPDRMDPDAETSADTSWTTISPAAGAHSRPKSILVRHSASIRPKEESIAPSFDSSFSVLDKVLDSSEGTSPTSRRDGTTSRKVSKRGQDQDEEEDIAGTGKTEKQLMISMLTKDKEDSIETAKEKMKGGDQFWGRKKTDHWPSFDLVLNHLNLATMEGQKASKALSILKEAVDSKHQTKLAALLKAGIVDTISSVLDLASNEVYSSSSGICKLLALLSELSIHSSSVSLSLQSLDALKSLVVSKLETLPSSLSMSNQLLSQFRLDRVVADALVRLGARKSIVAFCLAGDAADPVSQKKQIRKLLPHVESLTDERSRGFGSFTAPGGLSERKRKLGNLLRVIEIFADHSSSLVGSSHAIFSMVVQLSHSIQEVSNAAKSFPHSLPIHTSDSQFELLSLLDTTLNKLLLSGPETQDGALCEKLLRMLDGECSAEASSLSARVSLLKSLPSSEKRARSITRWIAWRSLLGFSKKRKAGKSVKMEIDGEEPKKNGPYERSSYSPIIPSLESISEVIQSSRGPFFIQPKTNYAELLGASVLIRMIFSDLALQICDPSVLNSSTLEEVNASTPASASAPASNSDAAATPVDKSNIRRFRSARSGAVPTAFLLSLRPFISASALQSVAASSSRIAAVWAVENNLNLVYGKIHDGKGAFLNRTVAKDTMKRVQLSINYQLSSITSKRREGLVGEAKERSDLENTSKIEDFFSKKQVGEKKEADEDQMQGVVPQISSSAQDQDQDQDQGQGQLGQSSLPAAVPTGGRPRPRPRPRKVGAPPTSTANESSFATADSHSAEGNQQVQVAPQAQAPQTQTRIKAEDAAGKTKSSTSAFISNPSPSKVQAAKRLMSMISSHTPARSSAAAGPTLATPAVSASSNRAGSAGAPIDLSESPPDAVEAAAKRSTQAPTPSRNGKNGAANTPISLVSSSPRLQSNMDSSGNDSVIFLGTASPTKSQSGPAAAAASIKGKGKEVVNPSSSPAKAIDPISFYNSSPRKSGATSGSQRSAHSSPQSSPSSRQASSSSRWPKSASATAAVGQSMQNQTSTARKQNPPKSHLSTEGGDLGSSTGSTTPTSASQQQNQPSSSPPLPSTGPLSSMRSGPVLASPPNGTQSSGIDEMDGSQPESSFPNSTQSQSQSRSQSQSSPSERAVMPRSSADPSSSQESQSSSQASGKHGAKATPDLPSTPLPKGSTSSQKSTKTSTPGSGSTAGGSKRKRNIKMIKGQTSLMNYFGKNP